MYTIHYMDIILYGTHVHIYAYVDTYIIDRPVVAYALAYYILCVTLYIMHSITRYTALKKGTLL